MKKIALAILIFISQAVSSQSRRVLDSLLTLIKNSSVQDTILAKHYNETAYAFNRISIDSSKTFAEKGLALSTKLNYKSGIAGANNALGIYYHMTSKFDDAIAYYKKSKDIKESIGDKKSAVSSQNNIGIIYYLQAKYDMALATFNASLRTQEGMKDSIGIPNTLNYIASVHFFLSNYEKALGYYLKALGLYKRLNDKPGMAQAYNNLGIIYSSLNNEEKAIENYTSSLQLANEMGARDLVTTAYNNLGVVFQKRKNYPKALEYFTKSLSLSRELKLTEGIAINLEKIGQVMQEQNKFAEALIKYEEALSIQEKAGSVYSTANILMSMGSVLTKLNRSSDAAKCYDRALKIAQEIKAKNLIADVSFNYAGLLKNNKDYKKAYFFMTQYSSIRDSILSDEKNKSMAEMQTRFDTDAKEKEIVLLTKNKDIEELKLGEQKENIEKQRVTIYASGISIILALALAFFGYRSYAEKKKTNVILEEKNHAISKQKEVLETKNALITSSIVYAKSIQDVILPPEETIKKHLKDSFILFKPKDVVSGDFYWLNGGTENNKNDSIYIAAIDCVGHGVPGGFMALHAYNLMERIAKENKNASPNLMLDQLNKQVIESLHQNNDHTSVKHGMDLALLKIKGNKIEFSGARNPLIIVTPNKELKEIKADKMFLGGALGNFTNNEMEVEKGSMLYVFTDGYADQKGGPQNKKYFISVLKELLISVSGKDPEEQKNILNKTFEDWKGSNEQMDDVLIVGIRV